MQRLQWWGGRQAVPGEIPGLGSGLDRTGTPDLGGHRGAGPGAGRHQRGVACHGDRVFDDRAGPWGTGTVRGPAPGRIRRPGGGRKPTLEKDPTLLADLEGLVRADGRGRPGVAAAVDRKSVRSLAAELQAMGHASATRWSPSCWMAAATACRPTGRPTRERAIRTATRSSATSTAGAPVPGDRPAGDLGGHQEEGTGRGLQECRAAVAAEGAAGTGAGARLRDPENGQGDSVRGVRSDAQRRLGQRRDRPRHGELRGPDDPPVVAEDGPTALSRGARRC